MGDHYSTGPKATSKHNLANKLDGVDDSKVANIHLVMNHRKKDAKDDNYDDEDEASFTKADNGDTLYGTPTITTKRQEKTKITKKFKRLLERKKLK
jgi:hypothetical protein